VAFCKRPARKILKHIEYQLSTVIPLGPRGRVPPNSQNNSVPWAKSAPVRIAIKVAEGKPQYEANKV
jgi:hypothetical protein